ncbi:MAG: CPBP family intramembrane glutamic endopeptidase [Gemmatimonadales bacterium]
MSVVRRHPLRSYYALAVGIASLVIVYWQVAAAIYLRRHGAPLDFYGFAGGVMQGQLGYEYVNLVALLHLMALYPLVVPALGFGLAPSLAAVLVTARTRGRAGLAALLSRLKPWRGGKGPGDVWRAYALILVAPLLLYPLFLWIEGSFGDPAWVERSRRIVGLDPIGWLLPALLIGAVLDEGGLLEELGWRGFATPTLLARGRHPLAVALMVGVLWSLWHWPRELPALLAGAVPFAEFLPHQIPRLVSAIAVSTIMIPFLVWTGGSVVPAIMIHGLTNFLSKAFDGMPRFALGAEPQDLVEPGLALLLVATLGPRLGHPPPGRQSDALAEA